MYIYESNYFSEYVLIVGVVQPSRHMDCAAPSPDILESMDDSIGMSLIYSSKCLV